MVSGVDMSKVLNSAAARTMSVSVANKKGELKVKISDAISKYKIHDTDRGSTGVQIAVLTEKINNLARHFLSFKKDKHSMRGYQGHINKRRKLMQYLKRKDFETFLSVVQALGLEKEATQVRHSPSFNNPHISLVLTPKLILHLLSLLLAAGRRTGQIGEA